MTLKYENQRTVSESLESIKSSLVMSHSEMQAKFAVIASENEKLKREVITKEMLLNAKDESTKEYIADMKIKRDALEDSYRGQIESCQSEYEDIRTLTV